MKPSQYGYCLIYVGCGFENLSRLLITTTSSQFLSHIQRNYIAVSSNIFSNMNKEPNKRVTNPVALE